MQEIRSEPDFSICRRRCHDQSLLEFYVAAAWRVTSRLRFPLFLPHAIHYIHDRGGRGGESTMQRDHIYWPLPQVSM